MNSAVRLFKLFHTHSYPACTAETNVPALSLQQCERITSNQWFTDEVRLTKQSAHYSQ